MLPAAASDAEPRRPLNGPAVTDRRDFDSVYADNATFVWRLLRGMGVTEALVPDAVQDVFVVVHRRLPESDFRHAVKTWLFEIAYRVACDYRRKQARIREHQPISDDLRATARTPHDDAEHAQSARLLNELLDAMDDDKRVVLVLSDVEEMTAPEIAEAIGVPLNTVYSRLRRARIELSEALTRRKRRAP